MEIKGLLAIIYKQFQRLFIKCPVSTKQSETASLVNDIPTTNMINNGS